MKYTCFKNSVTRYLALIAFLFLIGCNEYYLQHASVLTTRKVPTITTSQNDNRWIDIEVSGAYSRNKTASITQGKHTEYVSADGEFDYECASNPDCNDTLVNNIPFPGDNVKIKSTQWNANFQLSLTPLYIKKPLKAFRLRFLAEAQYGRGNNTEFWDFKFGPVFSYIKDDFAIHPKIILGYSKADIKYYGLIKREIEHWMLFTDSSYYTYTWEPESGSENQFRAFYEGGATIEWRMNKTFSILTDISCTYQYLFNYHGEYINVFYPEFSPAIKLSASKHLTIITGLSLSYNPDMKAQLPSLYFTKMHLSVGPSWGRGKTENKNALEE